MAMAKDRYDAQGYAVADHTARVAQAVKKNLAGANYHEGGLDGLATAQRETDIGSARAALAMARELSDYTRTMVDRLCGCILETTCDEGGGKSYDYEPDGVLPSIGSDARASMRSMSLALSSLRRLSDQI